MKSKANPYTKDWHEIDPSAKMKQLQVAYGLSSRATALIQGLMMASMYRKEDDFAEAMAIYISELESEIAENRTRER